MKRIIQVCGLIALVGLATFIWYTLRETPEDTDIGDQVLPVEDLVDPIELKIISSSGESVHGIEDHERLLFMDKAFISLEYLKDVYRFVYTYEEETNTLTMVYEDTTFDFNFNEKSYTVNYASVKDNTLIHQIGESFYLDIHAFDDLFDVTYQVVETPHTSIAIDFSKSGQRLESIDQVVGALPDKINLTWEAVYSVPTKVENLYPMQGLDIISPVWFELLTPEGEFSSKLQDDYIEWSKMEGYKLWPAITNSFDLDLTRGMVASAANRRRYIQALLEIYQGQKFHGLNVDFENMYMADKALFSQFIAELTAAFHRADMLVSIDVTFPGGSDNWSKCYDHKVLGEWVDFMIIMAYDQHWASSPVSGTVAGLEWLNKNLPKVTALVDSDKVVMALPFYMRVWYERPSEDAVNQMKVSSESITMHAMENILEQRDLNQLWDEGTGQNYVSYINTQYKAVNKIWIEDAKSLELKVDLVHQYDLKGIASWRRGYELQTIWPILDEALRKR